jgi:hypothetical protein
MNLKPSHVGCFGFILGGLLGLLGAASLLIWLAGQAVTPSLAQPVAPPADVTLFFSEQTAGRLASAGAPAPVTIDFEPGGRVLLTLPFDLGGLKPEARLGLTLEQQGNRLVSELHWLELGFLKIPAGWLPPSLGGLGSRPGEAISRELPPEFILVGLTTTADGLTFHLNATD